MQPCQPNTRERIFAETSFHFYSVKMVNHFLCIVSSVFIKMTVPGIFFLYFHLFTTFESKLMFNMYFEDDRIQTTDFWCQKQPSLPTEPQPQPHSSICLLRIAYCLHKIKYHGAEIVKRSLTERFLPTTKDPIWFKLTEFFEQIKICYIISELRSFVKYDIRKIVRKYLVILFLEKCRKCLIIF